MPLCQISVLKLYYTVIEDVISNVRDAFLDEGVDEQVLQEMKQIWTKKLLESKAIEAPPDAPEQITPPIIANSTKLKGSGSKTKGKNNSLVDKNIESNKPNELNAHPTNSNVVSGSGSRINVNNNLKQQSKQLTGDGESTSAPSQPMQQQQQQPQQQPQQAPSSIPAVAALDPNKIMPVNITLPAQPGTVNSESRILTIHVPASALQENQLTQILTAHLISSIMSLPTALASSVLQQHVNAALQNSTIHKAFNASKQMDGALDTSDEDGSEESEDENLDNDDDDDLDRDDDDDVDEGQVAEEEPLNSEDDVTDEDASDLFDTDNVVVCQYDKITRARNKWKFYLKDGIMNIGGKDYVFQKSNGDAEW